MSWDDGWPKDQDGWQTDDSSWAGEDGNWDGPQRRRRPIWLVLPLFALILLVGIFLVVRNRGESGEEQTAATEAPPVATEVPVLVPTTAAENPTAAAPIPTFGANGNAALLLDEAIYDLAMAWINESRREAGVQPVVWDAVAAKAGENHVLEMVEWGYFSHWNLDGLGPEHRYSRTGGVNAVSENLHARASVRPPDDWSVVIREAHAGLMDSPGHRANILDPAHTHVGIAIAFDATAGQVRMAQEFTNQYVALNRWLPLAAERGASVLIDGTIQNPNIEGILLDLAWEPIPTPLSVEELNQTNTYTSAAQSIETTRIERAFSTEFLLDNAGRPGIYHIRIFGDLNGTQALLMDHSIWVE